MHVCDADISALGIEPVSVLHALLDNNLSVTLPPKQMKSIKPHEKKTIPVPHASLREVFLIPVDKCNKGA